MNIDICYTPEQDRLRLSLRTHSQQTDWWLTRRMTLALVQVWVRQLQAIDLPAVAGMHLPRDLGLEHQLALEFDGPQRLAQAASSTGPAPEAPPNACLLQEATLTVQPTGSALVLKCSELQQSIELTRKESHAVLDVLANKSCIAGWLETPDWPGWLGNSHVSDA